MARKKRAPEGKKRHPLMRLFSAVGGGVEKVGGGVIKVGEIARHRPPAEEVAQRLREIKRIEAERGEEAPIEIEGLPWIPPAKRPAERPRMAPIPKVPARRMPGRVAEEEMWRKAELRRPLSGRLSDAFYGPLKRPAQRLARFFRGLGDDLHRANIDIAPERYAALILGEGIIVGALAAVIAALLQPHVLLALVAGVVAFGGAVALGRAQPGRKARSRATEVDRMLPFALRHMATHLTSGIGLPETMVSVARADYGALSKEFGWAIDEMNAGASVEEALAAVDKRVGSRPLRHATRQIRRAMRTGGDLARVLGLLADETAFELRMKLRGYTQSLNLLTMVYMFASAVLPAMLLVVVSISSRMGRAALTPETAALLYLVLLPLMLLYFAMIIKRAEPRL